MWRDSRTAGAAYAAALVGGAVAAAVVTDRAAARLNASPLLAAAATWTALGATTLLREATGVHAQLARGDLSAAREQVTHLVGRDPSGMDESEVARAVVESVAENTSDAVVAPLLWGAVAGVPGLLGYRALNTLDAMVGHRSPRYARFGWASARLDDAANLVPARVTAALAALASGRPRAVLDVVRRDARRHPSPNAGWCEAAFAGALELRLGGRNTYGGLVDERPTIGDGKPASLADIPRANALATRVAVAAAVLAVAVAGARR
ncbi:MAG: adenosylcobinamide-phosphate synthase [Pseudonocardiales bacterium]|nr:adenosylcobinamide-phosphate synthase [Pseudonocardiales bacterium]